MGWFWRQLWIRSFPHSQRLAPVRLGYPEFVEKPIFWGCLSVFRWTMSSEYHWNILAWLLVSCFNYHPSWDEKIRIIKAGGSKCSKYRSVSPKLIKHTKLKIRIRSQMMLFCFFGLVETTNKFLVPIQPSLAPGVASEQVLDLFVYTCDNLEDFSMKWEWNPLLVKFQSRVPKKRVFEAPEVFLHRWLGDGLLSPSLICHRWKLQKDAWPVGAGSNHTISGTWIPFNAI